MARATPGSQRKWALVLAGLALSVFTCACYSLWPLWRAVAETPPVRRITEHVVAKYTHDAGAFTQGLELSDGVLYESTGLYGQSSLRRVEVGTGEVLQHVDLEDKWFGEGITVLRGADGGPGDILMLTWKARTGFVYDAKSLKLKAEFTLHTTTNQGWGVANNGTHVFVSDGSHFIHTWRPADLMRSAKPARTTPVMQPVSMAGFGPLAGKAHVDQPTPVARLNELEFVDGELLANIWYNDHVARIDPDTGLIKGYYDLTGVLPAGERSGSEDCLNGIAWDASSRQLLFTGKKWPQLFAVQLPQVWRRETPGQVVALVWWRAVLLFLLGLATAVVAMRPHQLLARLGKSKKSRRLRN